MRFHANIFVIGSMLGGSLVPGCVDRVISDDSLSESGVTDDGDPLDDDDGELPEDDMEPPDDDTEPPDDDTEPPDDDDQPGCFDLIIEAAELPVTLSGTNAQGPSDLAPTCVEADSSETTLSFTAPADAVYTFSTQGSSFDTILYVLDGACDGLVLGCNDDADGNNTSALALPMVAGQAVTVVVDGFNDFGQWQLTVGSQGGGCPELLLPSEPEVAVIGQLAQSDTDTVTPTCAGSGPDIVYGWTPPFTARYEINTLGSSFDTVLAVFDGDCGSQRQCNDDEGNTTQSRIVTELEGGVPIAIAIERFGSNGGTYELTINPT